MASSSTPSSSITTLTKKHEVFLSFRGQDTRDGFTSHLYDALCRKQIETFIDDDKLIRGDKISSALLRAIQESKIAVVIFSENYASSKVCLRELTEIIKCMEIGLIVMPVFYHVYPTDVRRQTGSFGRYFANYEEKELPEEVQKWRKALTEASNLSGWDSSVIRPDSKLVGEIVETVWGKLRSKYIPSSIDFEGLVGIHERIEQVMSLLCLDMEDVRKIIGIWGMGGIGKTTIAQAVFKFISYKFDGACFIEKVGKRLENGGSNSLQLEVLSEVLHGENLKLVYNLKFICPLIKVLNQKRVFIVLDDVDTIQKFTILQLKTFVESLINRCGLGSRIIITSRDKQVLCNFNIYDHEIYKAEGFNEDEALELFHKHANPTEDCMALSKSIVYYAKGNPLALEVLGLSLKGKSKQVWESSLKKLQGIVNFGIFDVLKVSYDGLNEEEKKLFLDLACFRDLYCDYDGKLLKELLDCEYSLSVLIAKSLVTIHMETHELLQEMGREIVRRESPKNPGERSRLWERNDVIRTLKHNTGTDAVEGISLHVDYREDIYLSSQVFDKMDNLRILLFHFWGRPNKVHLPYGLNCFPNQLRILHWYGYPLRALPSNFDPKKLVKLDLSSSNIEQLWEGTKEAPNLKLLILSNCQHLSRIPNLSYYPLLVKVILSYSKSLVDFPSSVQQHNNLRNLNLRETAIEEVPSSIQSLTNLTELELEECTRLKHISSGICKLKSLSTLNLRGCSQLKTFPEILETMESLKSLNLCGSAIKVLPPSIEHLNGLQSLTLSNCKNLEMLPSSICNLSSLEDLHLCNCSKLDKLPDNLGNLKSLKCLDVSESGIVQLSSSITCLENLQSLKCYGCRGLTILPPLLGLHSLPTLNLKGCSQLETFPEILETMESLKYLDLSGSAIKVLPPSIEHLNGLQRLTLSNCKNLEMLPSSICNLSSLEDLHLCNCSKLDKLPDNLGNLKSLRRLEVWGSALGQLPSSITCLENLQSLNCYGCRGLTILPPLSGLHSLSILNLRDCSQFETFPEILETMEFLKSLDLSGSAIKVLHTSIEHLNGLKYLTLAVCKNLEMLPSSICNLTSLEDLHLCNCSKLDKLPDNLGNLKSLKRLEVSGTAVGQLPSSITCLENLEFLDCSGCRGLTMLPPLAGLHSLHTLYLKNCNLMEIPEDIGYLSSLKLLKLSGNMFESLPKSIKQLSKLEFLSLSHCKMLRSIPELPAGLKCLEAMDYDQLCQLPDAKCLENLEDLDCSGCSLMEIPEDIVCLSSLKRLKLSRNMFESLPKSIKQLSKLEFLSLSHCKMLRSIPELPAGLQNLYAMDCDQLCQVPDASEFVRCVNSKSYYCVKFRFTNCLNLIKAVSNVFKESLRIMQHTEKGSGIPSNSFSIYLPGNKIPEWFSYRSDPDSASVNIRVLRNDLVNRKFMGFAICAVLGFEEHNRGFGYTPFVYCDFEIYHDHIKIGKGSRYYLTNRPTDFSVFMHLEHMLLGYCSFSSFYSSFQNPNKLPICDSECLDISIDIKCGSGGNQPKGCAVHLIDAEEPIEIIGATIQEIGETSGRRSDQSDDNDKEVSRLLDLFR